MIVFSKDGCNNISHPMYFSYNMTLILLPLYLGGIVAKTEWHFLLTFKTK